MNTDFDLVKVLPSERQLKHQEMEFYAFFHFSVNTFTDKEWGDGSEDPDVFSPEKIDARQWAKVIKAANMKGAILTCKHHDGFCLWPSKYTKHSIAYSPYKNGNGDVVKEVSDALREEGLKFGIYLSPWDRNNEAYGKGKIYDDYFVHQLTELLTGYGDIFSVWFDGACGENKEGKKQYYDWDRYYKVIRKLQPSACITICGPDIRWCGNEAGDTRPSEWSVVPKRLCDAEKVAKESQTSDNTEFRETKIKSSNLDLGSREKLKDEKELIWYPAEVDTSIRPGWFYHKDEDQQVKSLQELIHIYEHSVGGNATLLLNIPPTNEGVIHENDVQRLKELGDYIRNTYSHNLIHEAESFHCNIENLQLGRLIVDDKTSISTEEQTTNLEIKIRWEKKRKISRVMLMEQVCQSQRIEHFFIRYKDGTQYRDVYEGTTVGYKKIAVFDEIDTEELMIEIVDSRVNINLQFLGVYE